MERLTKREFLAGHNVSFVSAEDCFDVWSVPKKFMGNAIERLAQIEDILGDNYDLNRLREMVEADRDGRCVVMPCKPGTQVWCVVDVVRDGYPDPIFEKQLFLRPFKVEWVWAIGKTVFLNREDAKVALAREANQ